MNHRAFLSALALCLLANALGTSVAIAQNPPGQGSFTIQLVDGDPSNTRVRLAQGRMTASVDGLSCASVDAAQPSAPALVIGLPDQPEACRRSGATVTLYNGLERELFVKFVLTPGATAELRNYAPLPFVDPHPDAVRPVLTVIPDSARCDSEPVLRIEVRRLAPNERYSLFMQIGTHTAAQVVAGVADQHGSLTLVSRLPASASFLCQTSTVTLRLFETSADKPNPVGEVAFTLVPPNSVRPNPPSTGHGVDTEGSPRSFPPLGIAVTALLLFAARNLVGKRRAKPRGTAVLVERV
jgi:hypothetical protein